MSSKIEWTEQTWNPVTGCQAVSPGCAHCWAAAFTRRHAGNPKMGGRYTGLLNSAGHFNGVVKCHEDLLELPLRRRKSTMYFVCSMSDLFGEGVPFEFIVGLFATMIRARQHTFQVLSKRSERMADLLDMMAMTDNLDEEISRQIADHRIAQTGECQEWTFSDVHEACLWPPPNVWLGASAENQEMFNARVRHLRRCPAAVRFFSFEPLLGPIDTTTCVCDCGDHGMRCLGCDKQHIHWVIVGGESGPGARPMNPDWVRSIRNQCLAAGVPFFFKQWGAWCWSDDALTYEEARSSFEDIYGAGVQLEYHSDGRTCARVGKKAAGRMLDGRTWDEYPEGSR